MQGCWHLYQGMSGKTWWDLLLSKCTGSSFMDSDTQHKTSYGQVTFKIDQMNPISNLLYTMNVHVLLSPHARMSSTDLHEFFTHSWFDYKFQRHPYPKIPTMHLICRIHSSPNTVIFCFFHQSVAPSKTVTNSENLVTAFISQAKIPTSDKGHVFDGAEYQLLIRSSALLIISFTHSKCLCWPLTSPKPLWHCKIYNPIF